MAIPGVTDVSQLTYKTTTRQYLDREGLIEYTNKIKSKIAEDITADLGKKITAESEARAAGDSALQQSINNLPAKAYSKITAVSGSTTTVIEASGKDNELKLKAGSNVALGVDTTNKAITINATDTKYSAATTTAPGLMSAADKVKLDGIATNANNYTLSPATSTTLGGVMVPANSGIELASDGKISLTKDKLVQMIGAFTGATASTAGQVGLVPAPTKGSTSLYLKSDGTWGTPTNTNTTYTLSPGTNNGTLKLTPSSGSAQDNIKVTGLGNLAYKNSLSASDVGALSTGADYIASATVNGNTLTLNPNGKTAITFTNSVYDKFIGATASTAGQVGLVPAPAKASTSLYLKSDGTWGTPTNTVYTHPTSGVEANTYRSVTVDAQGHVTAGTNPSTLDKYGITDAYIEGGTIHLGKAQLTPITSHQAVSSSNNKATFGDSVVVGKVGGTELKFTMPAKVAASDIDGTLADAQIPKLALSKINSGSIALTGGAIGTQNLGGSNSVSINVSEVKEGYLTWGGKNFAGSFGPIDAAMIPTLGANRLEACLAAGITVEYSRDGGSTWTDYGLGDVEKRRLLGSYGSSIRIGKATNSDQYKANYQVRVTLDTSKCGVYTNLNKFAIYISTGGMPGTYCTIEAAPKASPTAWEVKVNKQAINGWSGWNIINTPVITTTNGSSYYGWVRFTFGGTGVNTTYPEQGLSIYNILGFGGVGWTAPSTCAKYGVPYRYYAVDASSAPTTEFQGPVKVSNLSATTVTATTVIGSLGSSDGTMKIYAESNNELNFGGNNVGNNAIYFGYRAKDSKAIPTKFVMGGTSGTAEVVATKFTGALNGNATTATALTSKSIGSAAKPVYFDTDGKPAAISYTIEKSVPSNAVFTDTHCTTGLVTSNSATGTSNVVATNGNVYLNLKDDSTIRNSHKIVGSGATTVTSDASGTITIASTNTTYSAGTGISLSDTTFSNSGVRAISSGTTEGTISVNTGGTTANVAVKGLGTAAYRADTYFATAGHSHDNYASSVKTTGTGNAVTAITQSGNEITATKGATFLTSHQDISGKANLSGATFTGAVAITNTTASSSTTTGALRVSGGIGAQGSIYGARVYNAVWNDLADCIPVDDDVELEPGRCYCFNGTNYHKSSKYLADGIIGIHSDTYGMHMGAKQGVKQMDVAVAGFVLAYVDQEYPVGTPLTCGPDGMLVKIEREDKIEYPEKIIATYWKKEPEEYWGSETQKVKVNGRKWVKIK